MKYIDEYAIINKTAIQKRIEELENASMELFNLVHNSEGEIEFKIRANELYDVIKHKEIQSTPLIPEISKAFNAGGAYTLGSHKDFTQTHLNKQDYIKNLKLDI